MCSVCRPQRPALPQHAKLPPHITQLKPDHTQLKADQCQALKPTASSLCNPSGALSIFTPPVARRPELGRQFPAIAWVAVEGSRARCAERHSEICRR